MSPRPLVRLALSLALGAAVVPVVLDVPEAAAQPAPAAAPTVDLVLPASTVADGRTPLTMHVVAHTAAGAPLLGLKGKAKASAGVVQDWTEVGDGVYRFTWTPTRFVAPGNATLSFSGKTATKTTVERSWAVRLSPPGPIGTKVSANPARLTLGVEPSGALAIAAEGLAGRNPELVVRTTSGKVENVTAMGNGAYSASFVAPVSGAGTPAKPHLALVTVLDRRDPNAAVGAVAVPMVSRIAYPFTGLTPGASAIVKLGGREYPPALVDGNGTARVTVDVAPGSGLASVVQVLPDGTRRETPYDLRVPEAARWSLFPVPAGVPADGRTKVPVRAFVAMPDGRPDVGALVKFEASAGAFDAPRHEGNGIYVANYTPPAANAATEATLSVSLSNNTSLPPDSQSIRLLPARASRLTLASEPPVLAAGATTFKVYAKALGGGDLGLGGRQINFAATGAVLKDWKDLKNGDYTATFVTQGNTSVDVAATVGTPESGNPVARVLVLPSRTRGAAGTPGSMLVHVVAVDAFGYAVPRVPVTLRVVSGDGSVPSTVTTGPDGTVVTTLTTGRAAGVIGIEAVAGDVVGHGNVLQLSGTPSATPIPTSGDAATVALAQDWASGVALLRVAREGAGDVVSGPMVAATGAAGAATKILAAAEPAQAVPGAVVTLKVQLSDSAGRGVAGQTLDFIPSVGNVSGFQDAGGGSYVARLALPPTATLGEVKVAVSTGDGAMTTVLKVPVVKGDVSAWDGGGAFGAAATGGASTATTVPPVVPPVAPPVVAPPVVQAPVVPPVAGARRDTWLRASLSGSYGGYDFGQAPLSTTTVLFPHTFDISALSPGFEGSVSAVVPGLPYVGAELTGGLMAYALDPKPLCEKLGRPCASAGSVDDLIGDVRVLGIGRYPFQVGANRYWVGAKAGWSRSDVQAYKVVGEAIELDQLGVNALAIGPFVGADLGSVLLDAGFVEHLAGGSTPWNTEVSLNGAYRFGGMFLAGAGFRYNARTIEVSNADSQPVGELTDSIAVGRLTLGLEL